MTKYLILVLFLCSSSISHAQFNTSSESDPEAQKIIKVIKEQFEKNNRFAATFKMLVHYPGQEDIIEQGELIQSGDLFHLDLTSYLIVSNEEKKWVYLKNDNVVSLYNVSSKNEWLTPKDFLQIYDDKNFVYAMVPEEIAANATDHLIEFKSLDSKSEYSKMRLAVNKKTNHISSLKAFAKDGSRYELTIGKIDFNPTIQTSLFDFDTTKFPGIAIEDLRID